MTLKRPEKVRSSEEHAIPPSHIVSVNEEETNGQLVEAFLAGKKFPVFLDLSPDSSAVNTGKLLSILEWLRPRATQITIVEGSYLARWDLVAIEGLEFEEARTKAFGRADAAGRRINAIIKRLNALDQIHFLDWQTILESDLFQKVHSAIRLYASERPNFATEVHRTAEQFLKRMTRGGRPALSRDSLESLTEYVLEEVAGFLHLHANERIPIEVYPGADLPLMRHITDGHFENFPIAIPARTHISLAARANPLRMARSHDWPSLLVLIREWPTHYVEAAIPRIEADFTRGHAFVWEEDGRILGFMIWDTNGSEIEMKWLAVSPTATRRGIGSALVNAVLDSATTERRVFLLTATTDSVIPGTRFDGSAYADTIRFFERLGFRRARVLNQFWGAGNHALILDKLL